MMNIITADQYLRIVAAAVNGMAQNPAVVQVGSAYDVQQLTYNAMQGVEQAIINAGGQIVIEVPQ
jgi:hypothetical protein